MIFDLLTKPDVVLTPQETADVKKVARTLLKKLKNEKLVLDWRKQQTTRAMVLVTIKDELNELPRAYSKELYEQKCDAVCVPRMADSISQLGGTVTIKSRRRRRGSWGATGRLRSALRAFLSD